MRKFPVTKVGDRVEAHMLEDLVDITLHDINDLVGQINPSQSNSENKQTVEDLSIDWPEEQGNQNHPETFELETSKSKSSNSKEEEMADKKYQE